MIISLLYSDLGVLFTLRETVLSDVKQRKVLVKFAAIRFS